MKKILSKRQLIVALLSIVLFVTSMGLILGIKSNKVSAVEQESVTTGVKFTYNTEVTGTQTPVINFKLSSPISIKGASEIAFHLDLGPETEPAEKDGLYFGFVDGHGNYYEFGAKNDIRHKYRISNSLMGLVNAGVWDCQAWTSSAWLGTGTYYSFDLDYIFWRGSFDNYPNTTRNEDVSNIVGGGTLSDETKIVAVVLRIGSGTTAKVSFTISEMFARYDRGYEKLVDFSSFIPSTNNADWEGTNTNGVSTANGCYCQSAQNLGGTTSYGWLDALTELYLNHEVIKPESANVVSKDGITIKTNGITENVVSNGGLTINLPKNVLMSDVKNVIFTLDIGATFTGSLTPFVIDTNGNYYEYMGANGISASTIKAGRTYNGMESYSATAWYGISPSASRGDYGKMVYSMLPSDFYWRVRFNNYGGNNEDLTLTASGSLTSDATIRAIGVRVASTGYTTVDATFGDAYVEKTDGSIVKILDASNVTVNADNHFAYITSADTAWLGYVGNWGSAEALGWISNCYHVANNVQFVNGMDLSVVTGEKATNEFDGVNYKMTADTNDDYQSIIVKGNGVSIKDKTLIIRFKDNSGLGHHYELRVRSNGALANVIGSKQYFVDRNFGLVSSATDWWATYPPAGFDGYIVIDLSAVTAENYLGLTDYANVDLCFGWHQGWINQGLVDVTFGDITISETKATANSDFEALIKGSDLYYSFADDNTIDGISANLTTSKGAFYGSTLTRVYGEADEIEAVTEMIETATLNDLTALSEIEKAYNALSDNAKAQVVNAGALSRKLEVADELEAFKDSFDMIDGAAVRLVSGSNGMKFAATMDKASYEALETLLTNKGITFKMGTLIAPTDYGTLTVDATFKKLDVERTLWGEEVDGKLMMNAAITNILTDNYARDFSAIAYLSFEYEGETVVVYAGDVVTRSAKTVALEALADQTKTWTEAQLDVLNAYAGN